MAVQNGSGIPRGPGSSGPPDLDELLKQVVANFKSMLPTGGSGGGIGGGIGVILLALLALFAWTSYYTVPSDSVAVVQRSS